MEKEQFVARVANRLDAKPAVVEAAIDATLAEVLAPKIFTIPGQEGGGLFDNDCNNNCAAELASRVPGRIR